MTTPLQTDILTGLTALVLIMTFIMVSHKSLTPTIRTYAYQSILLSILAFLVGLFTGEHQIWIIAVVTLVLKGFAIPKLLNYIIDRLKIRRERESPLGIPTSLLACGLLVLLAYAATSRLPQAETSLGRASLGVSLSVVLIGVFIMATRRKAVTQTIGLLVMENGMFLAALSLTYGMPLIVELGVAFDVLVAAIVLGILLFNINQTFDTIDTRQMERLAE
ncbi:MAG: hydrogenase [Candidatus Thermoplasmatota archaeon]